MFYNAWGGLPSPRALDYLPWNDITSDFLDYRQAVQASITVLASFSLVTRNVEASISLHSLVYGWCRDRTSEDEEREVNYRRAVMLLASSVKWKFASGGYAFRRSLVFHVHEFLRFKDQMNDLSEEEKMQHWLTLALILAETGWRKEALQLTEEVVALYKSKVGADHPDTLTSMHSLAIRYSEAGRRAEALQLTEEVVVLRKSKLGADHPDALESERLLVHLSQEPDETTLIDGTQNIRKRPRLKLPRWIR